MGQFGAVPVPVLAQGPAAVAVPFPWRVELPALGALPAILRDLRQKFQQEKKKKKKSVYFWVFLVLAVWEKQQGSLATKILFVSDL